MIALGTTVCEGAAVGVGAAVVPPPDPGRHWEYHLVEAGVKYIAGGVIEEHPLVLKVSGRDEMELSESAEQMLTETMQVDPDALCTQGTEVSDTS